ncbi:interleukin-12 receptor subunit beta-1 isoform X2 [Brachyhypopomus gauderio]|uniref:interleukin-12 receptor subunit beta-1 isoform X2 n=1 Tax=Brachyhypopomus gauderio TaxID=698409 RepID=UPI004043063E
MTDTTCSVSLSPLCYKTSTQPQEDFFCEWKDDDTSQIATYTLFIRPPTSIDNEKFEAGNLLHKHLPLESLISLSPVKIWVQRQADTEICTSPKIFVTLINSVKYNAIHIKTITRSAGTVTVSWPRADSKGADHEIRWKKINASWQNETFVTEDSVKEEEKLDSYTLHVETHSVYKVELRRRAKHSILWSEWSPAKYVPLEIQQPVVHWTEDKHEGQRRIKLSWNVPPPESSYGGVSYNLTLEQPCKKKTTKTTTNTSYEIFITFSEARVSVIAINNVGNSPSQEYIIPPVEHLKYCHNTLESQTKPHCLEWYELIDGETRPPNVNFSTSSTLEYIKKDMKKFVRYYYFVHTGRNKHRRTVHMCPIYSAEGGKFHTKLSLLHLWYLQSERNQHNCKDFVCVCVCVCVCACVSAPVARPPNVTVLNETHNSAVVSWRSIPVQDQRGFLQDYVIWVSKEGHEEPAFHEVPANQTSFILRNLDAGSYYTVHIAGRTHTGAGPNCTANFFTTHYGLAKRDTAILIVCAVVLLISVAISAVITRLKNKLLPVIPSPVISPTPSYHPNNQDTSVVSEEVHQVILLDQKHSHGPNREQSTLLQDCDLQACKEEDEEIEEHFTDLHPAGKSGVFPNLISKGETLRLSMSMLTIEKHQRETNDEVGMLSYRNGLFFENRGLENETTSL